MCQAKGCRYQVTVKQGYNTFHSQDYVLLLAEVENEWKKPLDGSWSSWSSHTSYLSYATIINSKYVCISRSVQVCFINESLVISSMLFLLISWSSHAIVISCATIINSSLCICRSVHVCFINVVLGPARPHLSNILPSNTLCDIVSSRVRIMKTA